MNTQANGMETILIITIVAAFNVGLRVITNEGMLLGFLREFALKISDKFIWAKFILKPVILCVYCYSSFWGSFIYVGINGFSDPFKWIITIVPAVFVTVLFYKLIEDQL